jgi:hypothetical protein
MFIITPSIAKIKMDIIILLKAERNLKPPVYIIYVIMRVGCLASSSLYASSLLRVTSSDANKRSEIGEKSYVVSQAP